MIECRFSLELTKNGIQKTIYAKAGEKNARELVATLTQNGKVYELENHFAMIFLETGDNFPANIVGNSVRAVIPNAFLEPQVRVCELRISRDDTVIYSPMFELIFEESLCNNAEGESLVNGVQYIIKQEHDRADSHTINMVSGLREALDSKASAETVVAHYNEFNEAFSVRDNNLNEYAKRTDENIVALQSSVGDIKSSQASVEEQMSVVTRRMNTLSNQFAFVQDDIEQNVKPQIDNHEERIMYLERYGGSGNGSGGGSGLTEEQAAELAANTEARHTHENADVLENFSDDNGTLNYDGKPIGGNGGGFQIKTKFLEAMVGCDVFDGYGSDIIGLMHPDENGEYPLGANSAIIDIGIVLQDNTEIRSSQFSQAKNFDSQATYNIFAMPQYDSDQSAYVFFRVFESNINALQLYSTLTSGDYLGINIYYLGGN